TRVLDDVLEQFAAIGKQVAHAVSSGSLEELSTTLTLVIADPPWVALLAVGDGFVVFRCADGTLNLAQPPDPLPPTTGLTTFVTSAEARQRACRYVARIEDLEGIAISSDGLDELVIEYGKSMPRLPERPYSQHFDTLFGWAADSEVDNTKLVRMLAS